MFVRLIDEGVTTVEPATFTTGASGGSRFYDFQWQEWGGPTATGEGIYAGKSCEPSCAEGLVTDLPATVNFSDIEECDGRLHHTTATLRTEEAGETYVEDLDALECPGVAEGASIDEPAYSAGTPSGSLRTGSVEPH